MPNTANTSVWWILGGGGGSHTSHPFISETARVLRSVFFSSNSMSITSSVWYLGFGKIES